LIEANALPLSQTANQSVIVGGKVSMVESGVDAFLPVKWVEV